MAYLEKIKDGYIVDAKKLELEKLQLNDGDVIVVRFGYGDITPYNLKRIVDTIHDAFPERKDHKVIAIPKAVDVSGKSTEELQRWREQINAAIDFAIQERADNEN